MTTSISNTPPALDTPPSSIPDNVADGARKLGLRPRRAWVEDEKPKVSSAGADRTRRCREKAERLGLRQLSITVPSELHPALKKLAARVKAGEQIEAVVVDLYPQARLPSSRAKIETPEELLTLLPILSVWRRWFLRLILLPCLVRQR